MSWLTSDHGPESWEVFETAQAIESIHTEDRDKLLLFDHITRDEHNAEAFDHLHRFAHGRWPKMKQWVLVGPPGTGKSTLARACKWTLNLFLAEWCGEKHVYCRCLSSASHLIHRARQSMNRSGEYMDELAEVPVLIFDDLCEDNEQPTAFAQEVVAHLVNERDQRGRKTCAISNYDEAGVLKRWGPRIVSRIFGPADVIPVGGPDRRRRP